MSPEQQKIAIEEFNLRKGIGLAVLSGVMSACFAYGLAAGDQIKALTLQHGTAALWQGLPVLVVVLLGGFLTNFVWCLILLARNRTGHQYFTSRITEVHREPETIIETAVDAPAAESVGPAGTSTDLAQAVVMVETPASQQVIHVPMLRNYLLCALAGTTWYFQFFFYTMGESQMGRYKFSSWTLHMASIIIFSSLWGIGFREWEGAGRSGRATSNACLIPAGGLDCGHWLRQLSRVTSRPSVALDRCGIERGSGRRKCSSTSARNSGEECCTPARLITLTVRNL